MGLISKPIDFARLTRGALTKGVHIIGGRLAGCEAAWADDRKVLRGITPPALWAHCRLRESRFLPAIPVDALRPFTAWSGHAQVALYGLSAQFRIN